MNTSRRQAKESRRRREKETTEKRESEVMGHAGLSQGAASIV